MESQTKTQNKNQLSLFLNVFDRSLHLPEMVLGRAILVVIVVEGVYSLRWLGTPKKADIKISENFVPVIQIFYANDKFREENIFVLKIAGPFHGTTFLNCSARDCLLVRNEEMKIDSWGGRKILLL